MLEKRLNEALRSESSPPPGVCAPFQGDTCIKIASFFRVSFGLNGSTNHNPVRDTVTAQHESLQSCKVQGHIIFLILLSRF